MKKKYLSLLLCALLTLGLCTPAFAADESLEEELTRVTLAVKNTISIGDQYTDFTGNVDDMGALRYWSLNWSDENGDSIRVLATDAGKVMQYSANSSGPIGPLMSGSFDPTFSKISADTAAKAAEKFLSSVLTKDESAELTDSDKMAVTLGGSDYTVSAQILLNGIPSPNCARLQVSSETGEVVYFSRDDCYEAYVNDAPSAVPAVSVAAAADTLAGTVNLELQYVLPEDGDGSTAVLRYVPITGGNYYVDAQSGKLVDLSKIWDDLRSDLVNDEAKSASTAAGIDQSADSGLSDAEQAAIQKLQGVLSQDALDTAARKVTLLGLGRYSLSSASYSMDQDTGDVTCTINYTRKLSFSELKDVTSEQYQNGNYQQTKSLTLNAKTGDLLGGWSYRPWYMKDVKTDLSKLQSTANSFLSFCYPDYADKVALIDDNGNGDGTNFHYDRKENGYYYHNNYVEITIDPSDGSVASFCDNWDDGLKFQSAAGMVSADTAKSAYCGTYSAWLGYIAYPVSVNVSLPIWKTYADCCGYVAYQYVLGYTYETDGSTVLGVDAMTGKPIVVQTQKTAVVYTDITGSFAQKQIEALAAAGIGFGDSSEFKPNANLTQKDMLVLLLNSCGYRFDTADLDREDELESLYSAAWSEGFLIRGNRDPDHIVTRLEMVTAVIDASPYSQAAKLKGIFITSFTDAAQISADSLGYAAIAQGLGIIHGNEKGQFCPNATVTRQVAAVILYSYMNR
ncbi:MAG: S-layer homology domain-containing protein [Lawsonibacter sp.]